MILTHQRQRILDLLSGGSKSMMDLQIDGQMNANYVRLVLNALRAEGLVEQVKRPVGASPYIRTVYRLKASV